MSASSGMLRGVFVGIDRYTSPDVPELRFAEREATALHALFTDTFDQDLERGDATAEETWPAIYPNIDMTGIDVLKASHHGRNSGLPPAIGEGDGALAHYHFGWSEGA